MTWEYDGQFFPGWGNSEKARRHRQFLDMQKARRKQAKLDEWERKHDYQNVRSRMRLSLHLKVAEGHDYGWAVTDTSITFGSNYSRPKDISSLIARVQVEGNDSYE